MNCCYMVILLAAMSESSVTIFKVAVEIFNVNSVVVIEYEASFFQFRPMNFKAVGLSFLRILKHSITIFTAKNREQAFGSQKLFGKIQRC